MKLVTFGEGQGRAGVLDGELRREGFTGELNFADCTAALMPWRDAVNAPHRILFAGPAAGAAACLRLGGAIGRLS